MKIVSQDIGEHPESDTDVGKIVYHTTRVATLDPRHLERNRIVAHDRGSAQYANAFDLLRTRLLQAMDDHDWRIVAITSPTPECGKTVLAINLAISIARHTSKSALLLEFDLRRPRIASYLGLPPGSALNDYLAGNVPLEQAMVNPGIPRLVVLPASGPMPNATEVLTSQRVKAMLSEIRERYDSRIVIVDLPPVLGTDEAVALLPMIDCYLMAIANGRCSRGEIEDSLRQLPSDNFLGTAMTMADPYQAPYGY